MNCYLDKYLMSRFSFQQQTKDTEAALLYAKCLGIYGNWLAETKSENPNVIMGQYLQKVKHLLCCSVDRRFEFLSLLYVYILDRRFESPEILQSLSAFLSPHYCWRLPSLFGLQICTKCGNI